MHQIQFRLGSLQRFLRPPSWILRGPTSKGGEGKGRRRKGRGKGRGREEEGEGKGPPQKNLATGLQTNSKSYMIYGSMPFSVTLNDP